MALHASRSQLSGFYPCRSQFDQPFKKPAGRAGPAACEPQPFPSLVGLPVVAVVEKIDAVQIRSANLPPIRVEKLSRWGVGTKAMTLRVADRVREAPGNSTSKVAGAGPGRILGFRLVVRIDASVALTAPNSLEKVGDRRRRQCLGSEVSLSGNQGADGGRCLGIRCSMMATLSHPMSLSLSDPPTCVQVLSIAQNVPHTSNKAMD